MKVLQVCAAEASFCRLHGDLT